MSKVGEKKMKTREKDRWKKGK
jgi:hypothetical protein